MGLQDDITQRLSGIPDVRAWYVNDRGDRGVNIAMMGTDRGSWKRPSPSSKARCAAFRASPTSAANAGLDRPEVQIVPRTDEAARYGITTDQISEAVRVATIGDIDANLAKFNAGDRLIPIRVQLTEASRADLSLIEALSLHDGDRRHGAARRRSPTSPSARVRPRSTATTASAASPSVPISAAT